MFSDEERSPILQSPSPQDSHTGRTGYGNVSWVRDIMEAIGQ